jgi:hypothetical protein
MGGMLGIGGSSANTDRGNQLAATQGEWNLFGYGLPTGQTGQATGQNTLNTALGTYGTASDTAGKALQTLQAPTDYWKSLLTAGRTQTAQNAAPAIQSVTDTATANKNAESTLGTGRSGGTVAANREAGSNAQSQIDQIINSTLLGGQQAGAAGLAGAAGTEAGIAGTQAGIAGGQAGVGRSQLSNALSLLGLSQSSITDILNNATQSRGLSYDINQQTSSQLGSAVGGVISLIGGLL